MNRCYTTAEAGEVLRCSADKVRTLIEGGQLEAIDTSAGNTRKRWIVTDEALAAFQQRRTKPVEQKKPRVEIPTRIREWI